MQSLSEKSLRVFMARTLDYGTPMSVRQFVTKSRIGAQNVKLLFNIVPEAATYLGDRDITSVAKSTVFNNRPDALCVSGINSRYRNRCGYFENRKGCCSKYSCFANTGVRLNNVEDQLSIADGAVVGTTFKKKGFLKIMLIGIASRNLWTKSKRFGNSFNHEKEEPSAQTIFVIDFDGTISVNDSTTMLAEKYIPDMHRGYLRDIRAEKISVRKYIKDQLEALSITKEEYISTLRNEMKIDHSFKNFLTKKLGLCDCQCWHTAKRLLLSKEKDIYFSQKNYFKSIEFQR